MIGNYETTNYELQICYVHLFAIKMSDFIKMYLASYRKVSSESNWAILSQFPFAPCVYRYTPDCI